MKEIAKQTKIEEDAICEYIINGIDDKEQNKVCLYDASSIEELKRKLEIYEKMKA